MSDRKPVIVIDLDGTLIKTDLLIESFLLMIKQNPLLAFACVIWLLKGKAYMKREIAKRVDLPVEHLPYNQDVINYIKQKKQQGHRIALATASYKRFANDVSHHLGLFDDVFSTDGEINLSGSKKRAALNDAYGVKNYIYAGNHPVDCKVWQDCDSAIVVGSKQLAGKAESLCGLDTHIPVQGATPKIWLKALRVHQWVKNGLIFVPMLAAHQFTDINNIILCLGAFLAFSLCASSVYLLNDLLDLNDDRRHKTKRERPFAAGKLNLIYGLVLAPVLLVVAFTLSAFISLDFLVVLFCYYILTFAYSFFLKRIVLIDVITLAALYRAHHCGCCGNLGAAVILAAGFFGVRVFESGTGKALHGITGIAGQERQENPGPWLPRR